MFCTRNAGHALGNASRDFLEESLWCNDEFYPWNWASHAQTDAGIATLATHNRIARSATQLQIPIEDVPLGARVPTKNPKPWEYDDSLPEPVQGEWAKISITMYRNDGGIVDAELIRPRSWIRSVDIEAGKLLPMNIEGKRGPGTVEKRTGDSAL